jgi:hypothetical protein
MTIMALVSRQQDRFIERLPQACPCQKSTPSLTGRYRTVTVSLKRSLGGLFGNDAVVKVNVIDVRPFARAR